MEDEKAASGLTVNSLSSPCHLWPPLSAWNLKAGLLINLLASISRARTHRPALAGNGSRDNNANEPLVVTSQVETGSSDTTGVKLFLNNRFMLLTESGRPWRAKHRKLRVYSRIIKIGFSFQPSL